MPNGGIFWDHSCRLNRLDWDRQRNNHISSRILPDWNRRSSYRNWVGIVHLIVSKICAWVMKGMNHTSHQHWLIPIRVILLVFPWLQVPTERRDKREPFLFLLAHSVGPSSPDYRTTAREGMRLSYLIKIAWMSLLKTRNRWEYPNVYTQSENNSQWNWAWIPVQVWKCREEPKQQCRWRYCNETRK